VNNTDGNVIDPDADTFDKSIDIIKRNTNKELTEEADIQNSTTRRKRARADGPSYTVKNKKKREWNQITQWYARVAGAHCIQFGARDCFGCQNNLTELHNICDLPPGDVFVRYFDRALAQIDDTAVANELKISNCPNKFQLLASPGWRNNVLKLMNKCIF
jgi:hypothetical protein